MKLRKLLRQRGLGINLIAGFCFLLLAVYGWGLRWSELGLYFLAILVLLGGVIALAALCGYLLRKLITFKASHSVASAEEARNEPDSQADPAFKADATKSEVK